MLYLVIIANLLSQYVAGDYFNHPPMAVHLIGGGATGLHFASMISSKCGFPSA